MENVFYEDGKYSVNEANINFYANPFVHPERIMREYDFIYMLQGEWKLGQEDEEFSLKKDSLLILNENTRHFGISPCIADTKTMYFHVLFEGGGDGEKIPVDSLTDASGNERIKRCFFDVVNSKLAGNQRKADLYFKLLLCELTENNPDTGDLNIGYEIKNIIHNHPEKFFTNAELARMTNTSLKTAEGKFRKMFGVTIHRYILDFKIDKARMYFEEFPGISIKEVAYNLGFYDEYHFSNSFKKATGVSPRKYRYGK